MSDVKIPVINAAMLMLWMAL